MQRRHIRLVPQVRCIATVALTDGSDSECGRSMYYLNTKGGQEIYGCSDGHIRKLPCSTERNSAPPQDAA